jgi:DNA-binding NarL/FixJ family response regulator
LFKQEPWGRICEEIVAVAGDDERSPGREALRHATALAFARVKLTYREQLVLRHVAEGRRVQEVADDLCVSKTVVNNLLQSTRAKFEVRTTTAAVAKAYEVGLLGALWS